MGALVSIVSALAIWISAAAPHDQVARDAAATPLGPVLASLSLGDVSARLGRIEPPRLPAPRDLAPERPRERWTRAAPGPNVFGSVAIEMANVAGSARWRALLAEDAPAAFRDCRSVLPKRVCDGEDWARWRAVAERAGGLPAMERLAYVNRAVNRLVAYRTDAQLFGKRDHWASFRETVALGAGDCEDIALAKTWVLAAAGVPLSSMQVTVLRDTRRGLDHAVLAVHTSEGVVVLDNVRDALAREGELAHYKPLYSLTKAGALVHGRQSPVRQAGLGGATRLR